MPGKADMSDDTILSAYLDDELSPDDAMRLQDRLAEDPALAQRLEDMRSANLSARSAFRAADQLPLPQGVLDLLADKGADRSQSKSDDRRIARFPQRGLQRFFRAPVAIAASVALAAGFLAGEMLQRGQDADLPAVPTLYSTEIPTTSELHDFLESAVSGAPRVLPSGVSGRLLLTFENRDSDWCRQLQLAAEKGSVQALACRRNGVWQMEAVVYGASASPGSQYEAASSQSFPALDAAIDEQIGAGEPLGPEAESSLIANGWRKPAE